MKSVYINVPGATNIDMNNTRIYENEKAHINYN